MVSGEDLQRGKVCNGFWVPLQTFPPPSGGKVCNGGGGGGLQYNTGICSRYYIVLYLFYSVNGPPTDRFQIHRTMR